MSRSQVAIIVMVGCGDRGRSVLVVHPERCKVVAAVDPRAHSRAKIFSAQRLRGLAGLAEAEDVPRGQPLAPLANDQHRSGEVPEEPERLLGLGRVTRFRALSSSYPTTSCSAVLGSSNPTCVQEHMIKMFDHIASLKRQDNG